MLTMICHHITFRIVSVLESGYYWESEFVMFKVQYFYSFLTLDVKVIRTTLFIKTRGSVQLFVPRHLVQSETLDVIQDRTQVLYSWKGIWKSGRIPQGFSVTLGSRVHYQTKSEFKASLVHFRAGGCALRNQILLQYIALRYSSLSVIRCWHPVFHLLPTKMFQVETICDSKKHLFSRCSQSKIISFLICSENYVSPVYAWLLIPFSILSQNSIS